MISARYIVGLLLLVLAAVPVGAEDRSFISVSAPADFSYHLQFIGSDGVTIIAEYSLHGPQAFSFSPVAGEHVRIVSEFGTATSLAPVTGGASFTVNADGQVAGFQFTPTPPAHAIDLSPVSSGFHEVVESLVNALLSVLVSGMASAAFVLGVHVIERLFKRTSS